MNVSDKLYPADIKSQCDSATAILTQDNADIGNVRKNLENFITDDELVSKTYSTLKLQISDYLSILSAMTAANDMDIADLQTLKASVGSEELLGEVILSSKEAARDEKNYFEDEVSKYCQKAESEAWWSVERAWYQDLANLNAVRALLAKRRYDRWVEKEHKFDNINFTTKKLFTHSQTFRKAAQDGLAAVTKAFQDGKYIIDVNAEWRTAVYAENNRRIEEIKSGFMTEKEEGTLVYDWKKIEEWLKKDADEVTDLEYLAFVDIMSGMSNEDLGRLFSTAQISVDWLGSGYNVSEVMKKASETYLLVAQMEAELTIFDEHSKYAYDEAKITNELSKAYLVAQVMASMYAGTGKKHYIDITSEEEKKGKLSYSAVVTVSPNLSSQSEFAFGDAIASDMAGRTIRVKPWGSNALAQGDLDDCVTATLDSLKSTGWEVAGSAAGAEVTGYIFGKIGKATVDEFGGVLSQSASAATLILDIKENYENQVSIDGAIDIIEKRQAITALGIQTGVISLTGSDINEAVLICPKYDAEELYVRVEAYNSVHTEAPITVEEVKEAFASEGEALEKYLEWYFEEEGDEDIAAYWRKLEDIILEYQRQNPNIVFENSKEMDLAQIQELINKKNDPTYEINIEVMKE